MFISEYSVSKLRKNQILDLKCRNLFDDEYGHTHDKIDCSPYQIEIKVESYVEIGTSK